MSTAPPPMPTAQTPQEPDPGLSQISRIINTFIAPSKTFADIRLNASWWMPWLIGALFALFFGIVAAQKLDLVHLAQESNEQNKFMQQRMEQLSPEQREQTLQRQAATTKIVFYVLPVLSLIAAIIVAAILLAVFNFGFAAEIRFQQALAVVMYAYLPRIFSAILTIVAILTSSDPNTLDFAHRNPIATNLGFFMSPDSNKLLYTLASGIDVFAIWPAILMGIGFATVSANRKLKLSTGIAVVLGAYFLYLLLSGGISAAFS